ncbi:probable leucine-rich repeat receptor-like protein kinase [Tanacetum coccineum]
MARRRHQKRYDRRQMSKKTRIKHCKRWHWFDLELDNEWYRAHLYEMYMLLNPSQREELKNEITSQEELAVLQIEFAYLEVCRLAWCCWLMLVYAQFEVVFSDIEPSDSEALRALKDQWKNTPPSWRKSNDPCSWEGVTCSNSRIVSLGLSSMGLVGQLVGDIGGLTALTSLDLSFNGGLTGSISPRIGDLKSLNILILAGCSFTGNIPPELGNLQELSFLALNTNNLTGEIPSSLGSLSKLYWLDLAENRLTGSIPVSTNTERGLDQLKHAKHFHFNKNKLSGRIPEQLFSDDMVLIHVLFDGNQLTGKIPTTIGYVQTLEVLRLDRNALSGEVPLNLNNLTSLSELNLAHNNLVGDLPDLNGMNALSYVDLSNNSFQQSEPPVWFSTLPSLSTLVMEFGPLKGRLPQELFSLSGIQQVKLKNNALNDTLNMGSSISEQLQLVDLQSNEIEAVTLSAEYRNTLELSGNPVCDTALAHTTYCRVQQQTAKAYSTSLANCGSKSCSLDQKLSPQTCDCAYPYEGTLYFRAPSFRELSSANVWHSLEMSLWVKLSLTPGSVSLQNPFFNSDDYLQVYLQLFPFKGKRFNRSEIQKMGFYLSNQTYKPPPGFGPYFFIATPYDFLEGNKRASIGVGAIIGITTGCTLLVIILIVLFLYAVCQKKRAEKAIGLSRPFASWALSGKEGGGAPQLKGARWFSYDELKKSTSNFSQANQIGSGGYGKVYRGTVSGGQVVAIKKAQKASMQGGLEFKTEIELLSRVHHKNLVGLVGFCFEQGEQMLVYEFMSNGTLRDSLSGEYSVTDEDYEVDLTYESNGDKEFGRRKSGIHLDWKRRLRIALGSARGLTYLHELANPPIIHRDIKATNILLDENLTAKVADFGLSKLISDTEGHVSTQVKGTMGYLDPEYYMTQQLTDKSDVYSFGVLMLELVTAKPPITKGKYIVREVRLALDQNDDEEYGLRDLLDPTIKNMTYMTGFKRFIQLALRCVEDSASDRPTMSDVVKALENILISDGLHTDSTSASSSATDFGSIKSASRHPYNEATLKRNNSDAFDYSGGYNISAKVEPK